MSNRIQLGNMIIDFKFGTEQSFYTFRGDVDETFVHEQIPLPQSRTVFLNLCQINYFNSIGIREWIHFMRRLAKICSPILQECSVGVIDQINMVPDTLGNSRVESFFAPYYCGCGKESNRLIQVAEYESDLRQMEAPTFECECGQTLEFDAIEESYFQFLQHFSKVG